MSDASGTGAAEGSAPGAVPPVSDSVPSGNLFASPGLTALDPAEKGEQQSVERLIEALGKSR
jgi:hypothetical protein